MACARYNSNVVGDAKTLLISSAIQEDEVPTLVRVLRVCGAVTLLSLPVNGTAFWWLHSKNIECGQQTNWFEHLVGIYLPVGFILLALATMLTGLFMVFVSAKGSRARRFAWEAVLMSALGFMISLYKGNLSALSATPWCW